MPVKKTKNYGSKIYKNTKKIKFNKVFISIFVVVIAAVGIFVVYNSFASNIRGASFYPIFKTRVVDTRLDVDGPFMPGEKRTLDSNKLVKASADTVRSGEIDRDVNSAREELRNATGLVFNVTIVNPKMVGNGQGRVPQKTPVTIINERTNDRVTIFAENNKATTKQVILPIKNAFARENKEAADLYKYKLPGVVYKYDQALGNQETKLDLIIDYVGMYSTKSITATPQILKSFAQPILNFDSRTSGGSIVANQIKEISTEGACSTSCLPAPKINTMVVNVTAVNPKANGFIKLWAGSNEPATADLNFQAGSSTTNQTLITLRKGENIKLKSSSNTDVIVSVSGVYQNVSSSDQLNSTLIQPKGSVNYKKVATEKLTTNKRIIEFESKAKAVIISVTTNGGSGFMKSLGNTVLNSSGGYAFNQFIIPVVNDRVELEIYPSSKSKNNDSFINPSISITGVIN